MSNQASRFPYFVVGKVTKGFGRGSKQLGCPTANLEYDTVRTVDLENGIYYGFAQLEVPKRTRRTDDGPEDEEHTIPGGHNCPENDYLDLNDNGAKIVDDHLISPVYMMCCSLGWNPHFGNTTKSLEVHLLKEFPVDFYGSNLRVVICGHIRPEMKFHSLDALISAINDDINVTRLALSDESKWIHIKRSKDFFR